MHEDIITPTRAQGTSITTTSCFRLSVSLTTRTHSHLSCFTVLHFRFDHIFLIFRSKRRRVLDGGLLSPGLSTGGKKALYNCKYCGTDLSDTLRIRNASHSGVDLCADCFSVGVCCWPHKSTDSYRIVEDLSTPLFDPDWGIDEELLLLEALEIYGPGNWTEIAEHVGRKDKFQCRTHYFERYINSPTAPLPILPKTLTPGTNSTTHSEMGGNDIKNSSKVDDKKEMLQQMTHSVKKEAEAEKGTGSLDAKNSNGKEDTSKEKIPTKGMPLEGKTLPSLPSSVVVSTGKAEGNQVEITGYNVKRDDFEPEYDNDAETPLAELEIRREDSKEDREMKVEMLRLYFKRQKERYARRKFVLERGLLNVRKQQLLEKKRTKEEKEIYANMRVFARFQTQEEHEALVQGILEEQKLRQRIKELKEYRRMGVLTLAEAELYEQDKRRRESEREKLKSLESYLQQPAYKSSSAQRANRYFNRKTGTEEENNQVTSGSSRELQSLRIESNSGSEPIPNNIALVTKQMDPADMNNTPYLNTLSQEEVELCSSLRMLPVQYLSIKSTMMVLDARTHGKGLSRQDVREVSKVDLYKINHIYDFLTQNKVISPEQA